MLNNDTKATLKCVNYSPTPLFRSRLIRSPRYFELRSNIPLDLPLRFRSFTISYFELGYFEFPAISNSSFFPYTLNQPSYFELVKNRART